jgi:hypothetical protein
MSWLSTVASIILTAFPDKAKPAVPAPRGLEGASVSYVNEGRSGKVVFSRRMRSFEMYFEFGGDDTLAVIDVPSPSEWLKATGYPLGMRRSILEFIGQCVVRDQTAGGQGRFVVSDRSIRIHSR